MLETGNHDEYVVQLRRRALRTSNTPLNQTSGDMFECNANRSAGSRSGCVPRRAADPSSCVCSNGSFIGYRNSGLLATVFAVGELTIYRITEL